MLGQVISITRSVGFYQQQLIEMLRNFGQRAAMLDLDQLIKLIPRNWVVTDRESR
jgi:hypothetical protein